MVREVLRGRGVKAALVGRIRTNNQERQGPLKHLGDVQLAVWT